MRSKLGQILRSLIQSGTTPCLPNVAVCLAIWVAGSRSDAAAQSAGAVDPEVTSELRTAIDRGLAWLAEEQAADGSYGDLSHYGPHVGITGLAGLAFLSNGDMPGRGRYGLNVDRCLTFILTHGSESGLLAAETDHGPMYGHAFATLFLAEGYGMTPRPEVREALRKAVRLIEVTQNDEGDGAISRCVTTPIFPSPSVRSRRCGQRGTSASTWIMR